MYPLISKPKYEYRPVKKMQWSAYLASKIPLSFTVGFVLKEIIHIVSQSWGCFHQLRS